MFENADRYPFLRRLQDNHQLLTREFLDIVRSAGRDALTTRVHGRERRSSPVHPKKSLGVCPNWRLNIVANALGLS